MVISHLPLPSAGDSSSSPITILAPASEPLAYFNGAWLPASRLSLPVHDAGFVMGATVTDLCRTFSHQLYRWPDHLARFRKSCALAGIVTPSDAEITGIAQRLVEHNAAHLSAKEDLSLVVLATPGPIGYYAGQAGGAGDGAPTFALHTFPLPFARYRGLFTHGARLVTPEIRQVSPRSVHPHIKQRSRMHWWLADREARGREPGATALLLDESDHVTETAAANFLIVERGVVVSPPRSNILEGVSLKVVEELCREIGIAFSERPLTVSESLAADEALLTSTPYCIAGVSRLNGRPVPWPGPVCKNLLSAWSKQVGLDIERQVLAS